MRFYLGVTDNVWFNYLSRIYPEDVNFWQPGGTVNFKALSPGAPFLFKLKAPLNAIGGIGFFSSHTFLPISIAWDTFRDRNGCSTFDEFSRMILGYRADKNNVNPTIGCIVLTDPIFFQKEDWIETPANWANSIVQGKGYDSDFEEGKALWERVEQLLVKYRSYQVEEGKKWEANSLVVAEPGPQYGEGITYKYRIGQGAFRVLVTDAYSRRCAITGEKTLPVLEAAHIQSYSSAGPNHVSNGLLLRSDMHKLFDGGYLTITTNNKVEVSSRIKEEFQNGREYYQYHGKDLLNMTASLNDRPRHEFIEWHNSKIYKG